MKLRLDRKAKVAWFKVFSNICGNLSSIWLGLILASPGFDLFTNPANFLVLTRTLIMGILFAVLSFIFERKSR